MRERLALQSLVAPEHCADILAHSDHLSALSALLDAIKNLEALFVTIEDAYTANLSEGNYERHSDEVSPEALRAMEERGRAIQAEKKAQAAARP